VLQCGICGRRMQGQWMNERAAYRCRFTMDYPGAEGEHPKSVYVREDAIVPGVDGWLSRLFDEEHIDETSEVLAGVSEPDPEAAARQVAIREENADCDRKLANYRALLDEADAVSVAAKWIAETQRTCKQLERQLDEQVPGGKLTRDQVRALLAELRGIVDVLADAEPADKSELYN
jgi:site-specific DNA recombinase